LPPRFELPGPRRGIDWRAASAAIVLHVAFLLVVLLTPRRTYEETVRFVFIGEAPQGPEEIDWPSFSSGRGPEKGPIPSSPRAGARRGVAAQEPGAPPAGLEPGGVSDSAVGVVAVAGGGVGDATADSAPPSSPTPRLGSGSLWVRPLRLADFPEGVRESILGNAAATARLQALFDSIRSEPGAQQELPAWAVNIPGLGRAGIDSGWIMLGPIRIPAAVLALIPFPQGNIEEAERAERLAEMRADQLRAGQRAATVDEFKRAVRELRERKQRERDAERARRGRDTIIP